jgi:hypothetical protein
MVALPVVEWTPRPTSTSAAAYLVVAVAAGLALALGWHAALAAALTTVLNVAVLVWDQQTYSSHRLLATLLIAYLIFARSDAAWALSRRGGPVPWWPRLLMMTQLTVCYVFAAASKVSILFLSGTPLAGWVWVPLPWWMFSLMAFGTVLVEFFLAVGLWLRRTRRAAFALGGALHVSIIAMMSDQTWPLVAFGLTCISLYGLFASRESMPLQGLTRQAGHPEQHAGTRAGAGRRQRCCTVDGFVAPDSMYGIRPHPQVSTMPRPSQSTSRKGGQLSADRSLYSA